MTKNKKVLSLLNTAVIVSLGLCSANSNAETKFTPKFEIGHGSYELELTNTSKYNDANNIEQTTITTETAAATFITYAIGGALTFDRFMVDLTYKGSASGTQDYLNGSDICSNNVEDSCGVTYNNDGDFEHSEFAATLGYQLGSFVLFAGYQTGDTTLNHKFKLIADDNNLWGYNPGDDVTQDLFGVEVAEQDVDNETAGFFVGAGYGFPVGESGSISLSAGYSVFDVDLTEKWRDYDYSQSSSGDGAGISLAATYNYHLTNGNRVYVKFDYQFYTHDNFSNYAYSDGDLPADYAPADASEDYYRFSVGYAF